MYGHKGTAVYVDTPLEPPLNNSGQPRRVRPTEHQDRVWPDTDPAESV